MFTVKQVTTSGYPDPKEHVNLWEAAEVSYGYSEDWRKHVVTAQLLSDITLTLDTGIVYVMNEAGRTVDRYYLTDVRPVTPDSVP